MEDFIFSAISPHTPFRHFSFCSLQSPSLLLAKDQLSLALHSVSSVKRAQEAGLTFPLFSPSPEPFAFGCLIVFRGQRRFDIIGHWLPFLSRAIFESRVQQLPMPCSRPTHIGNPCQLQPLLLCHQSSMTVHAVCMLMQYTAQYAVAGHWRLWTP